MPGILLLASVLLLLPATPTFAQKAVQLEKAGSLHTRKFFVGDRLVYRVKDNKKEWLREVITNIHIEEGMIEFENRFVKLSDIDAIRTGDRARGIRTISTALTTFSGIWGFWTLVSLAYGDPLAWSTVAIGVGSFTVGQLLKLAFFKTHRLGKKKKRLRLIDLTFYRTPAVQKRT